MIAKLRAKDRAKAKDTSKGSAKAGANKSDSMITLVIVTNCIGHLATVTNKRSLLLVMSLQLKVPVRKDPQQKRPKWTIPTLVMLIPHKSHLDKDN